MNIRLIKKVSKEIKKLNPFLWAEEKDAEQWHKICIHNLENSWIEYTQSKKRLAKIKKRISRMS